MFNISCEYELIFSGVYAIRSADRWLPLRCFWLCWVHRSLCLNKIIEYGSQYLHKIADHNIYAAYNFYTPTHPCVCLGGGGEIGVVSVSRKRGFHSRYIPVSNRWSGGATNKIFGTSTWRRQHFKYRAMNRKGSEGCDMTSALTMFWKRKKKCHRNKCNLSNP